MYLSSIKEDKKHIIESSSKSSFLEVSEVHTSVQNEVCYCNCKRKTFLFFILILFGKFGHKLFLGRNSQNFFIQFLNKDTFLMAMIECHQLSLPNNVI